MADVFRRLDHAVVLGSIAVNILLEAIEWFAEPLFYMTGRLVEFLLLRPARHIREKIQRLSPTRTSLAGLKLDAGQRASPFTPEGYTALGFFSLLAAGLIIAILWTVL